MKSHDIPPRLGLGGWTFGDGSAMATRHCSTAEHKACREICTPFELWPPAPPTTGEAAWIETQGAEQELGECEVCLDVKRIVEGLDQSENEQHPTVGSRYAHKVGDRMERPIGDKDAN